MRGSQPLFLARHSYRRRRLRDAAKLMPVLGMALMLVPILWADGDGTSGAMIYIFTVWAILIIGIAILSRFLAKTGLDSEAPNDSVGTER